jgi:hypothetical protein
MILTLDQLIGHLSSAATAGDTTPSEALWIELAPERGRHARSLDFRTPDTNTFVRVYLDKNEAIVGIEIFP